MKRIVGKGSIWLLACLLLVQTAFAAGEVSEVMLTQAQQGGANLTLYAGLRDSEGQPVADSADPGQFVVSVDGHTLPVDSVQSYDPAVQGIHYVFAVDVSGSLSTAMMDQVHAALSAFVNGMGPNDTVTLITFGETVHELLRGSNDAAAIQEQIAAITPNENYTALYEGVITAVNAAKGSHSSVVVITDGQNKLADGAPSPTKDDIFAQLREARVPLYCIGMNDGDPVYGGVDSESLQELADATDGQAYIGASSQVGDYINQVFALSSATYEIHTTLANYDGKTSFNEPSSIVVGYQTASNFITSNELQQNINWGSVPAPAASVAISLELDPNSQSVMYTADGKTVLSGLVAVEQGSFDGSALSIIVNDEEWMITSLMRNGSDYTFSAEGVVSSSTEQLNVRAVVHMTDGTGDVASRVQTATVIRPTATPAPVMAVELDDTGRDILYGAGQSVTISGTINVQGVIDPNDMELLVNNVPCEMSWSVLQTNQYEFTANVTLPEQVISELKVQIVDNSANVRSHAQSVPLVTPTPIPDPELGLSLSSESVVYDSGEPLTISGNIEIVSGQVAPEDLALYVNSARWNMTELEEQGDGTYSFVAAPEHELVGNLTKLDVRVRLASNTQVSSDLVTVAVTTPEPPATPEPTARPVATPPPTPKATKAPQTQNDAETEQETGSSSIYLIVGGVVMLILIGIVAAVTMRKKKPKNEINPPVIENNSPTIRPDDSGGNTVWDGTIRTEPPGADFLDDSGFDQKTNGTIRLDKENGGTVRLDDEIDAGGTVRLDEEHLMLVVTIQESRGGMLRNTCKVRIEENEDAVIGRDSDADVTIDDNTVTSKHLRLRFDGTELYATDLGTTNGTVLNGERLRANEDYPLESGSTAKIGKTTLEFSFDKPIMV